MIKSRHFLHAAWEQLQVNVNCDKTETNMSLHLACKSGLHDIYNEAANLNSSPNIMSGIKSIDMKWNGHAERLKETRN